MNAHRHAGILLGFGSVLIAASIGANCIVVTPPRPLVITPDTLPPVVQDRDVNIGLQTTDGSGNLHWSVGDGSFPPGVSLDSASGTLSGRPQAAGSFSFFVDVQDSSVFRRTGTAAYTWIVIPKLVLAATLPAGRVGEPYSAAIVPSGGVPPYQLSLVGLPGGLMFDPQSGTVTGTPLVDSSGASLEASATDSGEPRQNVTVRTSLVIKPRPVSIVTTSLPAATRSTFYSTTIAAADGKAPLRWSVIGGVLPAGLVLNQQTGVISGIPTTAGSSTATIQVVDSDSPPTSANRTFSLDVLSP